MLERMVLLYKLVSIFQAICPITLHYLGQWNVSTFWFLWFYSIVHKHTTFFVLCRVYLYSIFLLEVLEIIIIELFAFVNPQILWFSTLFEESFETFCYGLALFVSQWFDPTELSEYLQNHENIFISPFHLLNCCISTRLAHQISSTRFAMTRRQIKLRLIGRCNSSANCWCQFTSSDSLSRFLPRDPICVSCWSCFLLTNVPTGGLCMVSD